MCTEDITSNLYTRVVDLQRLNRNRSRDIPSGRDVTSPVDPQDGDGGQEADGNESFPNDQADTRQIDTEDDKANTDAFEEQNTPIEGGRSQEVEYSFGRFDLTTEGQANSLRYVTAQQEQSDEEADQMGSSKSNKQVLDQMHEADDASDTASRLDPHAAPYQSFAKKQNGWEEGQRADFRIGENLVQQFEAVDNVDVEMDELSHGEHSGENCFVCSLL